MRWWIYKEGFISAESFIIDWRLDSDLLNRFHYFVNYFSVSHRGRCFFTWKKLNQCERCFFKWSLKMTMLSDEKLHLLQSNHCPVDFCDEWSFLKCRSTSSRVSKRRSQIAHGWEPFAIAGQTFLWDRRSDSEMKFFPHNCKHGKIVESRAKIFGPSKLQTEVTFLGVIFN